MNDVNRSNVERLSREISVLVEQRQELRTAAADPEQLEQNRRRIADLQWQLSHALIQRYLPHAA